MTKTRTHPDINTGTPETSVEVSIDWLAATLTSVSPEEVSQALSPFVREPWRSSASGWRGGYTRRLVGGHKSGIAYAPEGRHRNEREVLVDLPGSWCAAAGPTAIRDVLILLDRWQARPTRIDLAGDDLTRHAEVHEVVAALRADHFRSRARPSLETLRLDGPGHQVVIGSSASNRQLVVYDKAAESGDASRGVRWELRERRDAAPEVLAQLLTHDLPSVWRSRLVSFIDFVVGDARFPWYEALVCSAATVRALAPHQEVTLASRIDSAESLKGMFAAIEAERSGFVERYASEVRDQARSLRRTVPAVDLSPAPRAPERADLYIAR